MFTHDKEDGSLSVWVAVGYSTVSHEVDVSKCSRVGSRVVQSRCQDTKAQTVKTEDAHGEVILQYQVLYLLKHARMSKLRRRKS